MSNDLLAVKWPKVQPLAGKAITLVRPSFWEHASPSQYIFATLPPVSFSFFGCWSTANVYSPQYRPQLLGFTSPYAKKSPQFLTDINVWLPQQSFSEVKQILMFTTPCVTLGWCPSNHPGLLALQWDWGTQAVGIWVPAGSTKRNHFFSEGKIFRSHWPPAPSKVFFLFAWLSTSWL